MITITIGPNGDLTAAELDRLVRVVASYFDSTDTELCRIENVLDTALLEAENEQEQNYA